MKKHTAKKIYERAVLTGYVLNEDDEKQLAETHWKHKLAGTQPEQSEAFKKFKTHYIEEVSYPTEHLSRKELADELADRIEDKFDLHFSSKNSFDHSKLNEVKEYAHQLLIRLKAHNADKKQLAEAIETATKVHYLLAKLYMLS